MRRLGGVFLAAVGALSMLLGAILAVAFGPDDRLSTGPHTVRSETSLITTAPQAVVLAGPRVELTVTSRGEPRALFVGVGHHVDVVDLLGETPRTRIDRIELPWSLVTSRVGDGGSPRTSPLDVQWWYAWAQGDGKVVLTWTLPETGGDVVVAALDGRDDLAVDVTAAVLAPGAFIVGAAMLVIGIGVVIFGWAVLTTRVRPRGMHANRGESVEEGTS